MRKYNSWTTISIMLLMLCGVLHAQGLSAQEVKDGVIVQELAAVVYNGNEVFQYDVAWSGGLKIGEILFLIKKDTGCSDCYTIHLRISTTGGLIHKLYPVEDKHVTRVSGTERLPFSSEIWQKQGRYTAHKTVEYDQDRYQITRRKEGGETVTDTLEGVVYNEIAAFFASRVMDLGVGKRFLVPTFGDDSRVPVLVDTFAVETLEETLFGSVETLKVSPMLSFSGLYDKRGDTTIWYTNDECRVPVRITSKLVIGSLTATMTHYSDPDCRELKL